VDSESNTRHEHPKDEGWMKITRVMRQMLMPLSVTKSRTSVVGQSWILRYHILSLKDSMVVQSRRN
jgi:hypothetical protein